MIFSVDGLQWDVGCTVKRVAEMTPSEISGLLLDRSYFNDVIGTYLKYTVQIAVPFNMMNTYTSLYEILTEPVDAHTFVFPYGSGTITVTGRVDSIQDVYVRMPQGRPHWKGIQFTVIANHPTKEMSLDEVLTRGASPLPPEDAVNVGEVYEYSVDGWTQVPSAENEYY
jgi:hypothetical protein